MRLERSGLWAAAAAALVGGCNNSATIHETERFSSDRTLVTSADVRVINKTETQGFAGGRVRPKTITCAEPSPDIAKAVSASFNLSGSAGVGGLPANVKPEVAAAISLARAEGMAQLTQRLATIQLLRDGLYRACEAYANGAISDTTYAVLVSRYDDTMVTMLMGELAAGNFSGRMAAIGTGAGGSASARLSEATRELVRSAERLADVTAETPAPEGGGGESSSDTSRNAAKQAFAESLAQVTRLVAAESSGFRQNPQIAETIGTMQRKFIENINFDAVAIACINALDNARMEGKLSETLATFRGAQRAYDANVDAGNKPVLEAAMRVHEDYVLDKTGSPLAAVCSARLLPQITSFHGKVLDHILDQSTEASRAENAATALKTHNKAINEFLRDAKILEQDLANLPTQRTALSGEIDEAVKSLQAARKLADDQKAKVEAIDTTLDGLRDKAFEAEVAARSAEAKAAILKEAHDSALQAWQQAEEKAKQDRAAADGKPDEEVLKVTAEQSRAEADNRKKLHDEAKAASDKAAGEATTRRTAAKLARQSSDGADEAARSARERWVALERDADRKQLHLDVLRAEMAALSGR